MKNYEVEIRGVTFFDNDAVVINHGTAQHTIPPTSGVVIDWTATVGWGQLTIYKLQDGSIEIDSECMSENFIRQVMAAFAEYILKVGKIWL